MPITMLDPVEFSGIPSLNFVVPVVGSEPTGYTAGLIYHAGTLKYYNGSSWVALGPAGAGGPPTGAAGGDLLGSSYPSPTIAPLAVTDAKVATANKDGAAATPSMRTLGTGATQAAAGNDTRFTDSRNPTGTAGGALAGTYPNPTLKALNIVDADISASAAIGVAKIVTTTLEKVVNRGAANGYAPLDANSLVPTAHMPPLAVNEVFTVASQAAMLALTAQRGDMAIRTDTGKTYVLSTDSPATLADWKEVMAAGAVVSVNGNTGVVNLTAASVGAAASTTLVSTGNGLTGGGDLSTNRSHSVVADPTGGATIAVGASGVSVISAPKWKSAMTLTVGGTAGFTGSASFDGSAGATLSINGTSGARKVAAACAAAVTTTVAHNWATRDVLVDVYRTTTPWDSVNVTVERPDTNNILVRFATAPTAGQYQIVVTG